MYNHGTNDHGIISVFIRSSTVVFEVVHTLVWSNQQMCTIIKLYAILSTIDFLITCSNNIEQRITSMRYCSVTYSNYTEARIKNSYH